MAEEKRDLGEVFEFMRAMWALDHALQATSKRIERNVGITGPQRLALRIAERFPGISAGDLAEILHIHPSTLTGILRRLEDKGYVKRRAAAADRRRAVLHVTPRGKQASSGARGTAEQVVKQLIADVSAANVATARKVLEQLTAKLEANGVKPPAEPARSSRGRRRA